MKLLLLIMVLLLIVVQGCTDNTTGVDESASNDIENTLEYCQDDIDNDGDSFVDCDDQDCRIYAICTDDNASSGDNESSDDQNNSEPESSSDATPTVPEYINIYIHGIVISPVKKDDTCWDLSCTIDPTVLKAFYDVATSVKPVDYINGESVLTLAEFFTNSTLKQFSAPEIIAEIAINKGHDYTDAFTAESSVKDTFTPDFTSAGFYTVATAHEPSIQITATDDDLVYDDDIGQVVISWSDIKSILKYNGDVVQLHVAHKSGSDNQLLIVRMSAREDK